MIVATKTRSDLSFLLIIEMTPVKNAIIPERNPVSIGKVTTGLKKISSTIVFPADIFV
jgi:hypothetical protein